MLKGKKGTWKQTAEHTHTHARARAPQIPVRLNGRKTNLDRAKGTPANFIKQYNITFVEHISERCARFHRKQSA